MKVPFRRIICAALAACLLLPFRPARAEGTDIAALQARLISLGYEIGKADGIIGKKTSAAIALAQKLLADEGIAVQPTGIPGSPADADRPEPAEGQGGRTVRRQHGNRNEGL